MGVFTGKHVIQNSSYWERGLHNNSSCSLTQHLSLNHFQALSNLTLAWKSRDERVGSANLFLQEQRNASRCSAGIRQSVHF